MATRWDKRFFASTRGRVAALLRLGTRTVDELASELELTDNAVRAHLAALERDGLVAQGNVRRGAGKPSFTYQLTPEAERLFPKAYGDLLAHMIATLLQRMTPAEMDSVFQDVGHRLAAGQAPLTGDLAERAERALRVLSELGGAAVVERTAAGCAIQGCDCPIAAAVDCTPDACLIAETMLADLIGAPVHRACDPGPPAQCRFEIAAA